jgi:hypothetical protein
MNIPITLIDLGQFLNGCNRPITSTVEMPSCEKSLGQARMAAAF